MAVPQHSNITYFLLKHVIFKKATITRLITLINNNAVSILLHNMCYMHPFPRAAVVTFCNADFYTITESLTL